MNLEELELFRAQGCTDGSCEPKKKDESKEEAFDNDLSEKLLDDCVAKVCRYMYGANWETQVKEKSRKHIRKLIYDCLQLEVIEATEQDLGETLDLLEDSLFMMERIAARGAPKHLAGSLTTHMEAVSEHLEQWGMGDSAKAEQRIVEQMKDTFRD